MLKTTKSIALKRQESVVRSIPIIKEILSKQEKQGHHVRKLIYYYLTYYIRYLNIASFLTCPIAFRFNRIRL